MHVFVHLCTVLGTALFDLHILLHFVNHSETSNKAFVITVQYSFAILRGLKALGVRDLSYRLAFLACSVESTNPRVCERIISFDWNIKRTCETKPMFS